MIPNKIKPGDTIGVCAPSDIITEKNIEELNDTKLLLKEYKINVKYSKNLFSKTEEYSSRAKEKSDDLNNLVKDQTIRGIIFAKGGNNCNSLLNKIDYLSIKNNPKLFIGFSDNTVLLNSIYKKCKLITYHFTNFKGFCKENTLFNTKQFEKAFLTGYKGIVDKNSSWKTVRSGSAEGILIGGNLSSLIKILNTEYCPNFKNKILFLEELSSESTIDMVSAALYTLKINNVFRKVSGLLIGNYNDNKTIKIEDIVLDILKEYDFPIVKCNDFGHTDTNIVLPIGIKCTLDATSSTLIYNQCTTR